MASFHTDRRESWLNVAIAVVIILVVVLGLIIVGTVEGRSLNPDTDCRWDQVRLRDGTCL